MKTIIIYATKYGYTEDCVKELKEKLQGDVLTLNILTEKISSVDAFDNVIIGGSIYMGQINKKLKAFCDNYMSAILEKKVALFLSCGLPENFEQSLANAFPDELRKKAVLCECFGGELRTEKMKGPDRIISNLMKKVATDQGKPDVAKLPENIKKLALAMNS